MNVRNAERTFLPTLAKGILPAQSAGKSSRLKLSSGATKEGAGMAYEKTEVPIARSQELIRRLIYSHKGAGVSFVSRPPKEGFEALVTLQDQPFHIRVMATCKAKTTSQSREQEERRVWRVLFHHLKAMFEASDSGVIAVEDIILPYIVTPDDRTIAEHIAPRFKELVSMNGDRLLAAGGMR